MTDAEGALLTWLVIGAGITAGVFVIARAAIQLFTVAYEVVEKRIDRAEATRQGVMLGSAMVGAIAATAVIAGIAILALFAYLLQSGQAGQ